MSTNAGTAIFKAVADFGQVRRESRDTRQELKKLDRAGNSTGGGLKAAAAGFGNVVGGLGLMTARMGIALPLIFAAGGALIAAAAGALALAGSLSAVSGLAVLAPGLLAGTALAGLAVALALADVKTQLGDLAPALGKVQDAASDAFWSNAAEPIRHMANVLLPDIVSGMGDVGSATGLMAAKAATALHKYLGNGVLTSMFDATAQGAANLADAMDPAIAAVTSLGYVGAQYLPALGKWVADLTAKFNDWVQAADDKGKLKQWADGGITVLKELWSITKSTLSILDSLFKSAQDASPPDALFALTKLLKDFAAVLKRPEVREGLSKVFSSAYDAMSHVEAGLGAIGRALGTLGPTFSVALSNSGKILERVLGYVATLLASDGMKSGLVQFFGKLLDAVVLLEPAFAPLGAMLGEFLPFVGDLAKGFAEVMGSGAAELAPVLGEIFKQVRPLIKPLADLVVTGFKALAPVLMTIAKDVLPELVPLMAAFLPVLSGLILLITPALVSFFEELGKSLKSLNDAIGTNDAKKMSDFSKGMNDIGKSWAAFPKALLQANTGDKDGALLTLVKFFTAHPEVTATISALMAALKGGPTVDNIVGTASGINSFAEGAQKLNTGGGLMGAATQLGLLWAQFDKMTGISSGWNQFWGGLNTALSTNFPVVWAAATSGLAWIGTIFTVWQASAQPGWDNFWNTLPGPVQMGISLAGGTFQTGVGNMGITLATWIATSTQQWSTGWAGFGLQAVTGVWQIAGTLSQVGGIWSSPLAGGIAIMGGVFAGSWWANLTSQVPGLMAGINLGISTAFPGISGLMSGLPGQMASALLSMRQTMVNAGNALIQGFADGISGNPNVVSAATAVVARIAGLFPHSPAKWGPFSGRGYTTFSGAALVRDFGKGMASEADGLASTAAGVLGRAGLNTAALMATDLTGTVQASPLLPNGGVNASAAVAAAGGPQTVVENLNVTNPVPERASDSLPRAIRKLGGKGTGNGQ